MPQALAVPIFAVLGSVFNPVTIGGLLAISQVSLGISYLAFGVGLSYLGKAMSPKKQGENPSQTGSLLQTRSGGDVPFSILVGFMSTAGSLVYDGSWGRSGDIEKAYYTRELSLSDLPSSSLEEVWINGSKVTYDLGIPDEGLLGKPISEFHEGGKNHVWVKFYDGSQTTPDQLMRDQFGSDPDYPYLSDMIGQGKTKVIVTVLYNPDLLPSFPEMKFALNGAKFYDRRKDSTNGGSGAHRYSDQTTWEWTDNPQVINWNIFRGVRYGATWFWGGEDITDNHLPTGSWFAGMNECDSLVQDYTGGPAVRQYRCGAEIGLDMQPVDVIESLNQACNARIADVGGSYELLVGASPPTSFTFTDDNVVVDDPRTFEMFPGLDSLVNRLNSQYPEPSEGWVWKSAPTRVDLDAVDEDGKYLDASVRYGTVPHSGQVQRLSESALKEGRKFRKHTVTFPSSLWLAAPNITLSWTSVKNGYFAKSFRIEAVALIFNLCITAIIVETEPSDYSYDPGADFITHTVETLPYVRQPHIVTALESLMALKLRLQSMFDQMSQIAIGLTYKDEIVFPNALANVYARITTERTLRADADNAMAEQITTVEAVANQSTASGMLRFRSVAGTSGAAADITMEVRASNDENDDEWFAQFVMGVVAGVGSFLRLRADFIELDGTALLNGALLTDMIALNAVTLPGSVAGSGTIAAGGGSAWTFVASFTEDFIASPLSTFLAIEVDNTDGGNHLAGAALTYDSTDPTVGTPPYISSSTPTYGVAGSGGRLIIPWPVHDTPDDGIHTYRAYFNSDSTAVRARRWSLVYEETRR